MSGYKIDDSLVQRLERQSQRSSNELDLNVIQEGAGSRVVLITNAKQ